MADDTPTTPPALPAAAPAPDPFGGPGSHDPMIAQDGNGGVVLLCDEPSCTWSHDLGDGPVLLRDLAPTFVGHLFDVGVFKREG